MRRTIASILTLSLFFSFLLAVVVGLMVFFGELSLGVAVGIVILINGVMLLVSPLINDLIYRFFGSGEPLDNGRIGLIGYGKLRRIIT